MSVTYSQYEILPGGIAFSTGASGAVTDADSVGNSAVLGDTSGDTFSFGGATFTYVGTASFGIGQPQAGFVGANSKGVEFLFTPKGSASPVNFTLAITPPPGVNGSGEWNLQSGSIGCLMAGTRIATPSGYRTVESINAGDLVATECGSFAPVRWVGRSVVGRWSVDRLKVMPIRIRAGALGPNTPCRDLLVSPGHAILVGDVLAHAGALVNGHTIVRETDVPPVFTYYHVELDTHSLLIAEGASVESFLDGVEEMDFANFGARVAPPDARELPYPRVKAARQLPPAPRDLLARAAARLVPAQLAAA